MKEKGKQLKKNKRKLVKFAFDFGKVSVKIKQPPHTNQYNQMNSELLLSAQTHGNDPKAQNRPQKRAWLVRRKRLAISQSLVLYNKFWKAENIVPWVQKVMKIKVLLLPALVIEAL